MRIPHSHTARIRRLHVAAVLMLVAAGSLGVASTLPLARVQPAGDPAQDAASLQRALDGLIKTGGRLELAPGVFRLRRGISINHSKLPLELAGEPGAILRLEPAHVTRLSAPAAAGARMIEVENADGLSPGDRLELWLPEEGRYLERRVRKLNGRSLQLDGPLGAALLERARVVVTDNAVLVWDSAHVTLTGLVIDLQRERQPVVPRNHTLQCGILVNAPYKYATGPTSHSHHVIVRRCTVRAAAQRGIAFYTTLDSQILGCRIENTGAEAIDLDHFCRRIEVADNILERGDLTGIELNDVADSIIRDNRLEGYPVGIKCWHYEPCVMPGHNSGNRVERNIILSAGKHAVWFGRETHDNLIAGNCYSPGLAQAAIVDLGANNQRAGNAEVAGHAPAKE